MRISAFLAMAICLVACTSDPSEPPYKRTMPTEDDQRACETHGFAAAVAAQRRDAGLGIAQATGETEGELARLETPTDRERQAVTRAREALMPIVSRVYALKDFAPITLAYLANNQCMLDIAYGGHSKRNEKALLEATRACQVQNPPTTMPDSLPNPLSQCIKTQAISILRQSQPKSPSSFQ